MDRISERISRQLNDALDRWNNLSGFTPQNIRDVDLLEAHTLLAEAINSIAPKDSQYRRRADVVLADEDLRWQVGQLAGIVTALRAACWGGYLGTVAALVQADVFQDFLEMAEHLLDNGYKDPAAVLAGGVLEEHLRKACVRQGIETVLNDRPKPASRMNDELVGSGAYTQQDAKSVTAWLDLRNRAAHGKYPEYSKEQVGLMLHGVRHSLTDVERDAQLALTSDQEAELGRRLAEAPQESGFGCSLGRGSTETARLKRVAPGSLSAGSRG